MVAAEANNCSGGGRAAVAVAVKPVAQTAVVKAEAQSAASEVAAAAAAATGSRAAPAAGTACTATAAARAGHAGDAVCTACRRVYPIDVESYPVARLAGRGRRVRIGVRVRISNSRSENDEKISAGGKGVLSVFRQPAGPSPPRPRPPTVQLAVRVAGQFRPVLLAWIAVLEPLIRRANHRRQTRCADISSVHTHWIT